MLPQPPFVLLDDARPGGAARLYANPVAIVAATAPGEVPEALERLRAARAQGLHAAGYLHYEASAALEPAAWPEPPAGGTLLWFGLFESYKRLDGDSVPALLPDPAGAWAGAPEPLISESDYALQFARIAGLIEAGDIYQANLTFRAEVATAGNPAALYALLRARARAGYGLSLIHI